MSAVAESSRHLCGAAVEYGTLKAFGERGEQVGVAADHDGPQPGALDLVETQTFPKGIVLHAVASLDCYIARENDVVPVVLGRGKRYFGECTDDQITLDDPDIVIQDKGVLHLRYPVRTSAGRAAPTP